ncbi:NAD(P)H-hydrate dehydratase [Zavarzinia sp. CC-PAN008]|uniref:NAD(P)H-hydrate dehydratase n=1 Tax=Zavarzinia sp. CC-PAN008 TaxID=3243332 RepID=UPI003F7445EA
MTPQERDAALLDCAGMGRADQLTIAGGTPGVVLMERAGRGAAQAIQARFKPVPTIVLCGPGNNGGDGFVVARRLSDEGWDVLVASLVPPEALRGDAALMQGRWNGPVLDLREGLLQGRGLIVDALFGAGLSRPLDGPALRMVEAVAASGVPVVALDVPSGVSGDSGQVLGGAAQAALTVTFVRRKPGHLLLPGRSLAGEIVVIDIGVADATLDAVGTRQFENGPGLWAGSVRWPRPEGHKYDRGHALVAGGGLAQTGASRLAARAALRAGAGLVTLASPPDALMVNACHLTAVMLARMDGAEALNALLEDRRFNAVLLGPGQGVGEGTRACVAAALNRGRATVLDADALTSFADAPHDLFGAVRGPTVLTPHEGEFRRLFPDLADLPSKAERAVAAAARARAVVILKGSDTVVADPAGMVVIASDAPATLATAGSGDVLAGIVLGLLAAGMPAFEAAAAAVWLHAEAARSFGPGLIAEDVVERIPRALAALAAWPEGEAVAPRVIAP